MTRWQDPYGPLVLSDGSVKDYDPDNPGALWEDDGRPIVPNARPLPGAANQGPPPPPAPPHGDAVAPNTGAVATVVAEEPDANEFTDGTVAEVTAWVGDDRKRAQIAYDAESAKETPRKGLISRLEGMLSDD